MSEDTAKWQIAHSFAEGFNATFSDLESRISAAAAVEPFSSEIIQGLAAEVAALSRRLSDVLGTLPSYDQRQHEQRVKTLEQSLEKLRAAQPKSKFTFKRKANGSAKPPSSQKPSEPPRSEAPSSSNLILSSHHDAYLGWHNIPIATAGSSSDATIRDLTNCIVNLASQTTGGVQITALHIHNLKNCLLLLPDITGSVMLHDLNRCSIVVGCHQFRMHTSKDVDVFVSISSSPIVEGCSRIRFCRRSDPSSRQLQSEPLMVQDFSHIRPTPSPNWSLLPDGSTPPDSLPDSDMGPDEVAKLLDVTLPSGI
ncbi:hypothetical protein CCMSSC00406_0008429 [Pleurotus cornucopiae]|uniref:Uncharacterized protein n=1 Tax=Pleurotus cornucopiae TaxID=5321 RepID=A0ACB7J9J4_PLECO|nr:hypothetical protein CCMSSC00406_0008429 [Pleurotus cornucopiae]